MPEKTGQYFFPNTRDQVFDALIETARRMRLNVKAWDRSSGFVQLEVTLNFWSWGEDMPIQLTEPAPGQTWLTIASSSKFALFDLGKNKRNIDKLINQVSAVLAEMGQGYVPAPQPQQQQAAPAVAPPVTAVPPVADASSARECWRCHNQLPAEAKFCSKCGAGLPG